MVKNICKNGPRVQKYLQWKEREKFVEKCKHAYISFENDPVDTSNQLFTQLCLMSQKAGIDYLTPEIEELSVVRENHGELKHLEQEEEIVLSPFHTREEQERCRSILLNQYNYHCIDYKVAQGAHIIYPEVIHESENNNEHSISNRKADHIDLCIEGDVSFRENHAF